ncbi:glycerol-3-phosphate dehydrogenase/oxidase [Leptolyngbya sp. FACHB-261]|uniref:glycerol-3-phosphate dehydrogenase/oxidase n=1 Tax=Leptolyngbya sp. FACHB-261 TaxID=2692806 RepID=UPI00168801C5|nr:glycerol-3-phosphate dehydrogenase/oxidase [Leptolyngbya sp. FACHB-261]MBD2104005.1 glycerol-3-phosphate dehydrogenase/oxidase [Leptolyngbya sp. FACHB-261]
MNALINRENLIAALRQPDVWDLIVIGGGATGLGTAVEAANRGYKTLLLEQYDFAKGTSSRSTKLVHGGVRYLAQGNIGLVRESLRERGLLRRNAPHLVRDLTFVVPAYTWWSKFFYGAGLKVYDILAGKLGLGASHFLSKREILARMPTLNPQGLKGGIVYHDGQFDDSRLAIALLRTFLDYSGIALNYFPVTGLLKQGERVTGVSARDTETGERFELQARSVINATGIFVDTVRRMDNPNVPDMLSPSQGIHLVVDKRFQPSDSAIMIPHTEDGRVLFAVPWHNKVVIGTTDTPVEHVAFEPRPLQEEIDFILRTAAQYLANPPTQQDVLSVFVGQRPLVKPERTAGAGSTASLSRDHVIRVSGSGLITITGGKWTTYRKMGEDVVDQAMQLARLPAQASTTSNLHLHGWTATPEAEPLGMYGSDAEAVRDLPGADILLHAQLPYREAEVRWAARYELARTVEDVLARRTRALLLNARASMEAAPRVVELLAEELGKDSAWQQQQLEQYRSLAEGYLLSNPAVPADFQKV